MAQQQLGTTYRYHVSSLDVTTNARGKSVSASVTAWNEREIRNVPVEWEEH